MSDSELRKFGRSASVMADPKKNFGTPNPAFKIQLDEARANGAGGILLISDGAARSTA
jgi:hypothetical protein